MPNVATSTTTPRTAYFNAFWYIKFDPYTGKNKLQALLQYVNWNLDIADWKIQQMAEKKKPNSTAQTPFESIKFVNRNLSVEEKEDHDTANRPVEYVAVEFLKLALRGYSLKVSFDAYSKCMQATLLVWQKENANYGYGLSARGASAERAVSLLLYKHYDVLKENWSASYQAPIVDMEG